MAPRTFPFMLLAAGVVAASLLTRRAPGVQSFEQSAVTRPGTPRRIKVERDVPELGLHQGDLLRVEPYALIRVGDVVALNSESAEVVLTRFHDELMHCTAGLVVREMDAISAA